MLEPLSSFKTIRIQEASFSKHQPIIQSPLLQHYKFTCTFFLSQLLYIKIIRVNFTVLRFRSTQQANQRWIHKYLLFYHWRNAFNLTNNKLYLSRIWIEIWPVLHFQLLSLHSQIPQLLLWEDLEIYSHPTSGSKHLCNAAEELKRCRFRI